MKKTMKLLFKILLSTSLLVMLVSCTKGDFYLLGDKKMTHEVHTPFVDPGTYLKDDGSVSITGSIDIDTLGTYTLTYSATVNEKVKTLTRTVTVVDTTAPVITLVGQQENFLCQLDTYQEEGYSALDNLDGDLSAKVTVSSTSTGFIYKVTDNAGNLAELTRSFTQEDRSFPTLDLVGSDRILLPLNGTYVEYGASAMDNCDDVSTSINITSMVNTAVLGTYLVIYSVKDSSGNTTVKTRTVEVSDIPVTTVYLTFDDGPSGRTLEVLDILKEYGVKASFFVGKKKAELEYIMLKAYQEGHTVALHAYSHTATTIYASTDAFFKNLYALQDWVESVTGEKSYLYRFPGGSSNLSSSFNPGIMTTLTRMVQEAGFHYFDWNVSSGDGSSTTTSDQMVRYVTNKIKPGGTYIVLMHDSQGHTNTVEALPQILDYLQSIGATVLPITMDTPQFHHNVQN